jgi:hypothetical protein
METEYKKLILPIPRSGNYMQFKELADMLKEHGVDDALIKKIYTQIENKRAMDDL